MKNKRVKKWAYDKLVAGDVLFTDGRAEIADPMDKAPVQISKDIKKVVASICTNTPGFKDDFVAEESTNSGILVLNESAIIMTPADQTRAIDNSAESFALEDIKFDIRFDVEGVY